MRYETPDIKIDFKDNTFVLTGLDNNSDKEVKEYIESRGGIIKNSVTKSTDYLIYKEGKYETAEYLKALELANVADPQIKILSLSLFIKVYREDRIIEFGSYPFEADGTAKPIKWILLTKDGNKALLLSAYGLDAKPYNEEWEKITWETCTLRKWMNEDFYNAAFSDEERSGSLRQTYKTRITLNGIHPAAMTQRIRYSFYLLMRRNSIYRNLNADFLRLHML